MTESANGRKRAGVSGVHARPRRLEGRRRTVVVAASQIRIERIKVCAHSASEWPTAHEWFDAPRALQVSWTQYRIDVSWSAHANGEGGGERIIRVRDPRSRWYRARRTGEVLPAGLGRVELRRKRRRGQRRQTAVHGKAVRWLEAATHVGLDHESQPAANYAVTVAPAQARLCAAQTGGGQRRAFGHDYHRFERLVTDACATRPRTARAACDAQRRRA